MNKEAKELHDCLTISQVARQLGTTKGMIEHQLERENITVPTNERGWRCFSGETVGRLKLLLERSYKANLPDGSSSSPQQLPGQKQIAYVALVFGVVYAILSAFLETTLSTALVLLQDFYPAQLAELIFFAIVSAITLLVTLRAYKLWSEFSNQSRP